MLPGLYSFLYCQQIILKKLLNFFLCNKKQQVTSTQNNMDGSQRHPAKGEKPGDRTQTMYVTLQRRCTAAARKKAVGAWGQG